MEVFLFDDALNTFYLRLYGVRHMVKDHPDKKPAVATKATFSDRQDNTYHGLGYTSRGALAGTVLLSYGMLLYIVVVEGAGRSSEVERLLMVRWVVGSILH